LSRETIGMPIEAYLAIGPALVTPFPGLLSDFIASRCNASCSAGPMGFVVGLLVAEDPQPIGDTSGRAISAARTDPRKALITLDSSTRLPCSPPKPRVFRMVNIQANDVCTQFTSRGVRVGPRFPEEPRLAPEARSANGTLECMLLPIVQLHPSDEVKNPDSKEDLFQTLDTLCNARSWRLLH
jgi:hypothetical protein